MLMENFFVRPQFKDAAKKFPEGLNGVAETK